MTVIRAGNFSKCRSRVPAAEVRPSIPKDFRIAFTKGTEQPSIGAMRACDRVKVDETAALPDLEAWAAFERSGRSAAAPDARFNDNIHGLR